MDECGLQKSGGQRQAPRSSYPHAEPHTHETIYLPNFAKARILDPLLFCIIILFFQLITLQKNRKRKEIISSHKLAKKNGRKNKSRAITNSRNVKSLRSVGY